jgi:hypothetical protein
MYSVTAGSFSSLDDRSTSSDNPTPSRFSLSRGIKVLVTVDVAMPDGIDVGIRLGPLLGVREG